MMGADFSRNEAAAQQSKLCKRRVTMRRVKLRPRPSGLHRKKRGGGVAKLAMGYYAHALSSRFFA
jgi:hypothetical protein